MVFHIAVGHIAKKDIVLVVQLAVRTLVSLLEPFYELCIC